MADQIDSPTSTPSTVSEYQTALTQLRETVKWMITAAAATAGVIASSVQIKGLGALSGTEIIGAGVSALLALLLIMSLIVKAATILTVRRDSAARLRQRELDHAGGMAGTINPETDDPVLQEVYGQRSSLLPGCQNINEFYGEYVQARATHENLSKTIVGGADATEAVYRRRAAAADRVSRLEVGIRRLEDAVQYARARDKFDALTAGLVRDGAIFMIAILGFGVSTAHLGAGASVQGPVRATIYVTDGRKMGLPPSCGLGIYSAIPAVITGGDLNNPEVVTEPLANCPSAKYTAGFVAVPQLPPPPTPVDGAR